MAPVFNFIKDYFSRTHILYSLRILVVMIGVTLAPYLLKHITWVIPLTLGSVAAALTDLDDRLTGRLHNTVFILTCFLAAAVSIELLMPYPWLFLVGLLGSSFSFIMLGALSARYGAIAFGALLIAVYTMLGFELYEHWYQQPLLLVAGALWYYFIALIAHLLLPIRPLQDNITACYADLALYLEAKAALFDVDEEAGFGQQINQLALVNGTLVATFHKMKQSLITRLKNDRGHQKLERILNYYFVAQEIHEKMSSAHVNYQKLSQILRHSDILFRVQRLINLQAIACQKISSAITRKVPYVHNVVFQRAFSRLDEALLRFNEKHPEAYLTVRSLHNLLANLKAVDVRLAGIESEQSFAINERTNRALSDDDVHDVRNYWLRFKNNLNIHSSLFRHAIRMAIVLTVGYLIIHVTDLKQGYWIMLTSLFVCQPNYVATKKRFVLRVLGTIAGVLLGLPLLYLIPSVEGRLVVIALMGVLFLSFRLIRYAYATMFITIMVLFCFNLVGAGAGIAVPRIIDTIIGCLIAWCAVNIIWPDWRFRDPLKIGYNALLANGRYLEAIQLHYHQGRSNALEYRVARRNAHLADSELASVISGISAEPKSNPEVLDKSFRFLQLNHTLLGYISALGAHREKLIDERLLTLIDESIALINVALVHHRTTAFNEHGHLTALNERLTFFKETQDSPPPFIQQLILIVETLPELLMLVAEFKALTGTSATA